LAGAGADDVGQLLRIAAQAANIRPPLLLSAIFGLPLSRLPPYRRFSEYQLLNLWQPLRALRYLLNIGLSALPVAPPPFLTPLLGELFLQPSVVLQRPDHLGSTTSYPDESWFFVNGIMTNSAVAQLNAAQLSQLFHRPVTLLQNATAGLLVDLLQCAVGKQWRRVTEPVVKAMPAIHAALKRPDKRRVVVIAHSQGTIIMAGVLDLLYQLVGPRPSAADQPASAATAGLAGPEFIYQDDAPIELDDFELVDEDELAKLEVYNFATCANRMPWFRPADGRRRPLPWLEHFGNQNDLVARLGMLAPGAPANGIRIDGPHWQRAGAWGHLLGEHYLYPIEQAQRRGRKPGGRGGSAPFGAVGAQASVLAPRLYAYINGGSPAPNV
jgi:hypothetical protein